MAGVNQDLDPAKKAYWKKARAELIYAGQGHLPSVSGVKERPVILHSGPSITQSPLLYRVSAALRDAPSRNSHHSNQLQQEQDAANAKKSLENCEA